MVGRSFHSVLMPIRTAVFVFSGLPQIDGDSPCCGHSGLLLRLICPSVSNPADEESSDSRIRFFLRYSLNGGIWLCDEIRPPPTTFRVHLAPPNTSHVPLSIRSLRPVLRFPAPCSRQRRLSRLLRSSVRYRAFHHKRGSD